MILLFDVYGVAFVGKNLNRPLLEAVQGVRAKGVRVGFASNMASLQKPIFWEGLGLKKYGERIFCSGDLGVAKPSLAFYSRVAAEWGAEPDSILFFDDSPTNVEAAKQSGWKAFLYTDVETTLQQIEKTHGV
jgi:HAD superfamily hydrolase (TIGR01509 family)